MYLRFNSGKQLFFSLPVCPNYNFQEIERLNYGAQEKGNVQPREAREEEQKQQ
jgi:hypothetical protein